MEIWKFPGRNREEKWNSLSVILKNYNWKLRNWNILMAGRKALMLPKKQPWGKIEEKSSKKYYIMQRIPIQLVWRLTNGNGDQRAEKGYQHWNWLHQLLELIDTIQRSEILLQSIDCSKRFHFRQTFITPINLYEEVQDRMVTKDIAF